MGRTIFFGEQADRGCAPGLVMVENNISSTRNRIQFSTIMVYIGNDRSKKGGEHSVGSGLTEKY